MNDKHIWYGHEDYKDDDGRYMELERQNLSRYAGMVLEDF